jgi:predicted O-linked N-acetylglucosamine transferase (SPINDLY family)
MPLPTSPRAPLVRATTARAASAPPSSGLRIPTSTEREPRPLAAAHPGAQRAWSQGVAHTRAGRHVDAARALEHAVKLAPGNALYWINLASVRRKLRQFDAATRCARRAFDLDPKSEIACHLLVELLRLANRHTEALKVLRALHPDAPRDAQHRLLEGALLMTQADWQGAAAAFLQLLAGEPGHIEAYTQLGFCLANLKQFAEAAECFRTVALLEPAQLGAAIYAAHYGAWACDWAGAADDERRMTQAIELQQGRHDTPAFSPFCLLSMNDDAALHRRAAALEGARIARAVRGDFATRADWAAPDPGPRGYPKVVAATKRRIGFVSADFRTHATSMLLVQVLERLDRSRFEVVLYSHGADDGTPLRARMVAAADAFVECAELTLHEQAARIRDDGIAILVDLSGYTQNTRLGVFALRPAPVQALWLAYPSTSGADFIDYLIGDPVLTPLAHADDFSEKLAQLPLCYEPTDRERIHPAAPARIDCGLPEGAFVYACFNQSYKITQPVFAAWCRILARVPGSVLWLLVPQENIRARLAAQAEAHGIDAARVLFAPFVSPDTHLARLQCADVFLDTFPYGAHTTCSDALWMSVPVLTRIGRSFSARVAASLLNAVGLPELAVEGAADYEELAVRLAEDRAALADIRRHLREHRLELPLFDSARFTQELGALFERMLDRWQQGQPPQALPAAALGAGA